MLRVGISFFALMLSAQVVGDVARFNTEITRIMVHGSLYGQCMARVTQDIPSLLPNCNAFYVTFDCAADLPDTTRMNSSEKFNVAKTALVMGRPVFLEVIDTQTINGFCLVNRIDMN